MAPASDGQPHLGLFADVDAYLVVVVSDVEYVGRRTGPGGDREVSYELNLPVGVAGVNGKPWWCQFFSSRSACRVRL